MLEAGEVSSSFPFSHPPPLASLASWLLQGALTLWRKPRRQCSELGRLRISWTGGTCHRSALVVRNGLDRSGRGGAPASSALARAHSGVATHEFFMGLTDCPHRWLRLPDPFTKVMARRKPPALRIRVEGCLHDPIWFATRFEGDGSMFLEQGWKMFVRWRNLKQYQCVLFRYDGEETVGEGILPMGDPRGLLRGGQHQRRGRLLRRRGRREGLHGRIGRHGRRQWWQPLIPGEDPGFAATCVGRRSPSRMSFILPCMLELAS